jgi:hypothetical protein
MAEVVPWVADFALRAGLKYEPEPDERWLRVWEPYVTLRNPIRYEHALGATGTTSALTIARFVLAPREGYAVGDEGWIAIGQDERLGGTAAATSDASPVFRDEATSLPRRTTGDPAFDAVFASYADSDAVAEVLTPSVRKLALEWRTPVHFEIRRGGFILAPVALRPDPPSLAWLLDAARVLANKAAK